MKYASSLSDRAYPRHGFNVVPPARFHWLRQVVAPLALFLLKAGCCIGVAVAAQAASTRWLATQTAPTLTAQLVSNLFPASLVLVAYCGMVVYSEKRRVTELQPAGLGRSMVLGMSVGLALQTAVVLVMYLAGAYTVQAWQTPLAIMPALGTALNAAAIEEVVLRGLFFRLLEERLGSWAALAASALLFGLLHLANPGSSLGGVLAVAVEAGVLLGAAFLYSRNLWLPLFVHFAWNFSESGIFGAAVSGYAPGPSLLAAQFKGPSWLTGGAFGPENSVQAALFCVLGSALFLRLAYQRGHFKQPLRAVSESAFTV